MSQPHDQIFAAALKLPAATRARLARLLVESLNDAIRVRIRKSWAGEAIRRRNVLRSGKIAALPGGKVLARVRRAVGR